MGAEKTVWTPQPERSEAGNPIRFQGQYHDDETGLHYNRYRYYDPTSGRFVSKEPIGLTGGINVYQCAPNSTLWIDPLGLSGTDVYRA
ncbi:RHS repeat-associated core domain-containing protein [Burkholderia ubonensis]|uniref:RHS repeat-associated core domain-containing protein n=1 Tax=Burkholderia ubonensis TaxID=101571 RepID=UPI000AB19A63